MSNKYVIYSYNEFFDSNEKSYYSGIDEYVNIHTTHNINSAKEFELHDALFIRNVLIDKSKKDNWFVDKVINIIRNKKLKKIKDAINI